MSDLKFRVQLRVRQFLSHLKETDFSAPVFYVHILGWLLGFYAVIFTFYKGTGTLIFFIIFIGYFWRRLSDDFREKISPPSEVLIILLLFSLLLEAGWLNIFLSAPKTHTIPPGEIPAFVQVFLLALAVFFFGQLLIQNNRGKKRIIIYYVLLAVAAVQLLESNTPYFWYIFQFILVLFLMRTTTWAEELTKVECWIYFGVFLILFIQLPGNIPRARPDFTGQNLDIWYSMPQFLFTLYKLYLLAVLIKIPLVLVYHHASLSRKLRIAARFQSSFPLIIQFLILLLVFYFFIGGWQAENIRKSLQIQTTKITAGSVSGSEELLKFQAKTASDSLTLPGYTPLFNISNLPENGIVTLPASNPIPHGHKDYFFFFRSDDSLSRSLYFVKLDSAFFSEVGHNASMLAATRLDGYPFQFTTWDSVFYNIGLWQAEAGLNNFRVFPFGIIPHRSEARVSVSLAQNPKGHTKSPDEDIFILGRNKFTMGRVFSPLLNNYSIQTGYWAFDIVIVPNLSFFVSPLSKQLLFWLIIYLLVSALVIRRVVKFGHQIHTLIIQKFTQLRHGIRQISEGNLDYKISLEGEDEFVELAGRFNQMGEDLKRTIAEVREKDRLEYELKIAREVQLSLLPRSLPRIPGYQLSADIRTAREVGGDFYDVLPVDNHRYLFVIGDVSGKSTSAAFYMAQCLSLIRYSRQFTREPREILIRLNRYFAESAVDRKIFVTAVMGVLDIRIHRIEMLRAGHTHPYLVSADGTRKLQELKTTGLGIGLERNGRIFEKTLEKYTGKIGPGDALILYTDGLVEASLTSRASPGLPGEIECYGEERLRNRLAAIQGQNSQEILEFVMRDVDAYYQGDPPVDDYSMVVIHRSTSS